MEAMFRQNRMRKRINDESISTLAGGAFVLLLVIGASCVIFFSVNRSPKDDGGIITNLVFYGIIFGLPSAILVGLAFLVWHRKKFGKAVLILDSFPVKLGEKANGSIEISRRLSNLASIRVCLRCEKVFPSQTTGERITILWRNEWLLDLNTIALTDHSTAVPITFALPPDGNPTRHIGWIGGQIRWRLQVESLPSNGPHFSSDFFILVVV